MSLSKRRGAALSHEEEGQGRMDDCQSEGGEEESEEGEESAVEGEVDWEAVRDTRAAQLRGLLEASSAGLQLSDEREIDHLLARRNMTFEEQAGVLTAWCLFVIQLREQPDPDFVAESTSAREVMLAHGFAHVHAQAHAACLVPQATSLSLTLQLSNQSLTQTLTLTLIPNSNPGPSPNPDPDPDPIPCHTGTL